MIGHLVCHMYGKQVNVRVKRKERWQPLLNQNIEVDISENIAKFDKRKQTIELDIRRNIKYLK